MKKPSAVVFINKELEKSYYALPNNDPIKKSLTKAIRSLQTNAFIGTHIPKKLIPKVYVRTYGINNLWKYDLPKG